uniref:Capsid n=1 Tax=viral metagenome TaxID=1070528 RepID=A0A2V0RL11_9ZZZZ
MSNVTEKYKGKLPRPAKDQSVKEFEEEEIKPDAEYTEFNSVKDILAKPDYFEPIINTPEFMSMLEKEGITIPTFSAQPKEAKVDDDKKEKVIKQEEEPKESMKNTDEEEPKASIDVVMVPSLEEISPTDTMSPVEEMPSKAHFEPVYRRIVHPLTKPVSFDVTHGLATLNNTGLEDMYIDYSGDRTSKKGRVLFRWLQTYRPMSRVESIKYDSSTGLVDFSNHSHVFTSDVAGNSATSHAYEVSTLRPKVEVAQPGFRANVFADATIPDVVTSQIDGRVIDLSISSRPIGSRIKSADVIMNPWRAPIMLRDMAAYNYMTLSFNDWKDVHVDYINQGMLRYVRERNAKERDVITNTTLQKTAYDRYIIGSAGANSVTYYYETIPNYAPVLCESVLGRSFSKASEAMSTIAPSQRSISTNITNRQASSMLLNLTAVQPSAGANLMRDLGAYLLGGRRHVLEIDVDDGATKTPLLNALSSMASLIVLDRRFMDERSKRQLLVNVLLPFYDEFPTRRNNVRDVSRSVHEIADDFLANAATAILPDVTKMVDLAGRGRAKGREIKMILQDLLRNVMVIKFEQLGETDNMFKTGAARPYMPFSSRDDITDIVLFGTRTDGDESRMHEMASYRPGAIRMANALERFSDVLGRLRQFDGLGLAVSEAMKTSSHLPASMAIFTDAFVHGSVHTDLLSATTQVRYERSVGSIVLPFDGALSFLLYGIGSSEMSTSNDSFVRFKSLASPTMPSLYPAYLYFERSIVGSAYAAFKDDLLITHFDMVVSVCLDALKVYFNAVDPESASRISYLFDERETLENQNLELPASLTSSIFSTHQYMPKMGANGPQKLPGSFETNEQIHESNGMVNPYKDSLDAADKIITKMYIDFKPLVPIDIETYNQGTTLVYTKPSHDDARYLSLKEIVKEARYIDSLELSIDGIKNMAIAHLRRMENDEEIAMYDGVMIDTLMTTFKFVEHKGLSDLIVDTPKIKIDRNPRMLDTDFEVSEVSIYYHRVTDRQGDLSNPAKRRELDYLNGFLTYVSVSKKEIQKSLINFDHIDPMDPSIYKVIRNQNENVRLEPNALSSVRIRDGRGITYAGTMTLSTRESEEIGITTSLNPKEEF